MLLSKKAVDEINASSTFFQELNQDKVFEVVAEQAVKGGIITYIKRRSGCSFRRRSFHPDSSKTFRRMWDKP